MPTDATIVIRLREQRLRLVQDGIERLAFDVSTASRGAGCLQGSGCTPTGLHRIRAKVGAGCAPGTVFVGRRATGEVYTPTLGEREPGRDWILTRILWLDGLEHGINKGGEVDTLRRFVYIHGTADEASIGRPASHGCVRMRNADIVRLFEAVRCGTRVDLQP